MCNGFVQWLIKRDPEGYYHFGTITSDRGKAIKESLGITHDTVVLILQDWAYTHADVALQVGKRLGGGYRLLSAIASVCPRPLRDKVYAWVARNRYRWFGKYESCPIPDATLRARLIDI